ncbi:MAG: hypothetical protein CMK06_13625 [Ponticaulis sp.]|nr:hypothetical protein [Ponticaulis sp.]
MKVFVQIIIAPIFRTAPEIAKSHIAAVLTAGGEISSPAQSFFQGHNTCVISFDTLWDLSCAASFSPSHLTGSTLTTVIGSAMRRLKIVSRSFMAAKSEKLAT